MDNFRYEVREGDTLATIGEQLGMPWQELFELNKSIIGPDPNVIKPGMVLVTDPAATEMTPGFSPSVMSNFNVGK